MSKGGDGHAGYDGSGKSPGQIEEDISDTRAELGEILDELERKLAPRHLLERGMDMLKDGMSGDVGGIGETLRRHPVPVALIGIGIGWAAISAATGRGRLGEYGHDIRHRVSGAVQGAAGKVGEVAGQVRDKVAGIAAMATTPSSVAPEPYPTESADYAYARQKSGAAMAKARETAAGSVARDTIRQAAEAGNTVRQRAGQFASAASDRLLETRDRLTELLEANPLAVGALGFLAGSLLALMLPRSQIETRLIGETSEQIRARAAEGAQRVTERTVGAAMDAVKEAVSETADTASPRHG